MKLPISIVILFVSCSLFAVQPAQNRSNSTNPNEVQEGGGESAAEKEQRIKDCEVPDRVKPQGDIKRVSQLCGHAISFPKPSYPEEAKSSRVSGTVVVEIVTNERGLVVWAKAISGPEPLRRVSEQAACRARYSPTLISGRAIQTQSTIQYFFTLH